MRPQPALASLALLVALLGVQLTASGPPAVAEDANSRLQGHVPATGGLALLLWTGGSTSALLVEAERKGCSVLGIHVNQPGSQGGLVSYIPDTQIAAANQPFFEAFPTGRLESMPVLLVCRPRIQGLVLGDDGEPRADVIVSADESTGSQLGVAETRTAPDGTFDLVVDRGSYVLRMLTARDPYGDHLGWYSRDGLTVHEEAATVLHLRSRGVKSIEIHLPSLQPISGIVRGPEGEPFEGVMILGRQRDIEIGDAVTGPDGTWALEAAAGHPVTLTVLVSGLTDASASRSSGGVPWHHLGWYGAGGYTTRGQEARTVTPGAADALGVEIWLPAIRTIGGVVRGADGVPPARVDMQAYTDDVAHADVIEDDGSFAIPVPAGVAELLYRVRPETIENVAGSTSLGWVGRGGITLDRGAAAAIDTTHGDVTDLRVYAPTIYWIRGVVRQTGGTEWRPASIFVYGWVGGRPSYTAQIIPLSDGRFELPVIDGRYAFAIGLYDGQGWETVAHYDLGGGVTYACGAMVPSHVNTGMLNIEIILPGVAPQGEDCE